MKKGNIRESNIELLRIIAVIGVIVLHFNGSYSHALEFVGRRTTNYYILKCLESIFIPAVNLFVLISGYYLSSSSKRKIVKPMQLIAQVILFGGFTYLLSVIDGTRTFSITSMAGSMIPCNYYVILYAVLYIVSPYINLLLDNLSEKKYRKFVITVFSLFSVWPMMVDVAQEILGIELMGLSSISMHGSQNGYTIVNFCLMYIIGAYIRKIDVKISMKKLLLISVGCIICLTVWSEVSQNTAWAYCNPIVIVSAVAIFLLFQQLCISSKVINFMAKGVFTCFLFHGYFLLKVDAQSIVKSNTIIMIAYIIVIIIVVYSICLCASVIYGFIEQKLLKRFWSSVNKLDIWSE